jgi:hypothetical protein
MRHLADRPLKVVFRGVCREQVEAFVADAATDLDSVLREVERLRSELADVNAKLTSVHADERETARTISRAEHDACAIREAAERQAVELQRAAEAKAAALLHDLEREREQINRRIARCAESRARLTRVLQTEIDELGQLMTLPVSVPTVTIEELHDEPPVKPHEEAWSAEDVESALRGLLEKVPMVEEAAAPVALSPASATPSSASTETMNDDEIHGIAADPRYVAAAAEDESESDETVETHSNRGYFPRVAWGSAAIAGLIVVALVAFPRTATDVATPAEAAPATPAPGVKPVAGLPTPPVPTASPDSIGTRQTSADRLVIRMQATRPCWIGVTIGEEKETRLLAQGEEITREADSDLVLRIGDAGALVVTVNDRRLPPLGADGEVVTRRFSRN